MRPFRILSVDGGGIRGIIPAVVLREIEKITKQSISALFDLMAGTSTGGIIACGLATPGASGGPRYAARDMARFYEKKGPEIFHLSPLRRLFTLGGWAEEKYPAHAIERELMRFFGITSLSETLTPLLIPAYEIERRFPFFFKSHRAVSDAAYDYPLWQAARATSAAPAYFEPAKVTSRTGRSYALIDGGVFANNPALCAFVEARAFFEAGEIVLVSLGTGKQDRPIPYEKASGWGKAGWAPRILDVMMDGVSDTVDYQLRQLLDGDHYFRFQADLNLADDDMDDTSPLNLLKLREQGERLVARERTRIEKLCGLLAGDQFVQAGHGRPEAGNRGPVRDNPDMA